MESTDRRVEQAMVLLNAEKVGPKARHQLRGLLKYYAKKPHPFRACVRDNTKRFGPGGAKRICATLKDLIRGQKKWRGKNNPKDRGVAPWILASEQAADEYEISEELGEFLMGLPEEAYEEVTRILWQD